MKSQAFASAWLSPLATSAPALPCLPCPPCSVLLAASSLCPGICQRRSRCSSWLTPLGHSRHSSPLSSSSHLCESRCYIREPQELKQTLAKSVRSSQPSTESVMTFRHSLVFSTQESPLTYHADLSSVFRSLTAHLFFPLLWVNPTTAATQGQGICLPNFVSQAASLERAV